MHVYMQVLELEDRKGEWGFKALKQMMKILFRKVSVLHCLYMLILFFVHQSVFVVAKGVVVHYDCPLCVVCVCNQSCLSIH